MDNKPLCRKNSAGNLSSAGNTLLFNLDFSWRPAFLETEILLSSGYSGALSPEDVMTCFRRMSESPSCTCQFSNSFSLKYLVCPGAYSELCYYKANRLIILGTLACFSKKQASRVLMLNELLSEGEALAASTIMGNESPGFYY